MRKAGLVGALIFLAAGLNLAVAATRVSFGNLTMTDVAPRIITPNDDRRNDVVFFRFDSSITGIPLTAEIFDITGAKVSGMTLDTFNPGLKWDGKDDSGKVVPAGIYIYSIKIGQKNATGTVVVAR